MVLAVDPVLLLRASRVAEAVFRYNGTKKKKKKNKKKKKKKKPVSFVFLSSRRAHFFTSRADLDFTRMAQWLALRHISRPPPFGGPARGPNWDSDRRSADSHVFLVSSCLPMGSAFASLWVARPGQSALALAARRPFDRCLEIWLVNFARLAPNPLGPLTNDQSSLRR